MVLEALGEDLFPYLLHFLEASHTPCLMAPSSVFTACMARRLNPSNIASPWRYCVVTSPSLTLVFCCPFLHLRTLVIALGLLDSRG